MALIFSCSSKMFFFLILTIFSSLQLQPVAAFDFTVGEDSGWVIPPPANTQMYNKWASKNRFQVGDALEFRYKKDSVMAVSDVDYAGCNSSHPIFFSNSGHTKFKIDHPGLFYFISGVSGHCEKGQKMIIKVLGHTQPPENSPSPPGAESPPNSSAAAVSMARISYLVVMQFFILVLGLSLL